MLVKFPLEFPTIAEKNGKKFREYFFAAPCIYGSMWLQWTSVFYNGHAILRFFLHMFWNETAHGIQNRWGGTI